MNEKLNTLDIFRSRRGEFRIKFEAVLSLITENPAKEGSRVFVEGMPGLIKNFIDILDEIEAVHEMLND